MDEPMQSIDRRLFLGAGASTLMGLPALAQQGGEAPKASEPKSAEPKPAAAGQGKRLGQVIADYVVGFELKDAPAVAIDRARVAFTDTVGVMLAGSRQDVSHILCDMVRLEGSTPSASIVGQSLRASPQLAALANGVAAHAMDYDLTYVAGQAASAVIPAVLPVAEITGATPAEAMAATIIGFEVAARVGRANFLASSVGGWHTVGTVGVIAAAAACARLLKVPVEQIPDIIGISASMASGLSVNFGSMTKPLHSGHAARDGVMAALLGRAAASPRTPTRSRGIPAISRISAAASRCRSIRSRIWAAATISSPWATISRPIRAAGWRIPRSRRRWRCASAWRRASPTSPASIARSPAMPASAPASSIRSRSRTPSSAWPIWWPIRWCTARR